MAKCANARSKHQQQAAVPVHPAKAIRTGAVAVLHRLFGLQFHLAVGQWESRLEDSLSNFLGMSYHYQPLNTPESTVDHHRPQRLRPTTEPAPPGPVEQHSTVPQDVSEEGLGSAVHCCCSFDGVFETWRGRVGQNIC